MLRAFTPKARPPRFGSSTHHLQVAAIPPRTHSFRRDTSSVKLFGARRAVLDLVATAWDGGLVASAQRFSNVAR